MPLILSLPDSLTPTTPLVLSHTHPLPESWLRNQGRVWNDLGHHSPSFPASKCSSRPCPGNKGSPLIKSSILCSDSRLSQVQHQVIIRCDTWPTPQYRGVGVRMCANCPPSSLERAIFCSTIMQAPTERYPMSEQPQHTPAKVGVSAEVAGSQMPPMCVESLWPMSVIPP